MNVIWWRTGETNKNYSTGSQRLEPAVIAALIRCPRGLTSWFPNCLVFPKTVSHQKTSSRESKSQTGANVDSWAARCLGTGDSQDGLVPQQRRAPFIYIKCSLSLRKCHLTHPLDSLRVFWWPGSCWQIAVYSPTFLPDRNSKISEWKILSLMTGKI